MTKEEKIKEAWGELMPDYTNIDLNSGWSLDDFHEDSYKEDEFHTQQIYIPCKIRPKSLQGIEDNNGWIKIESEDDLPKEDMDCFYITKYSKDVIVGCFRLKSYKGWRNMFTVDHNIAVGLGHVTHYQPIVKPKPPIY